MRVSTCYPLPVLFHYRIVYVGGRGVKGDFIFTAEQAETVRLRRTTRVVPPRRVKTRATQSKTSVARTLSPSRKSKTRGVARNRPVTRDDTG